MKIPSTPLTFLSFTKTAIHVPGFGHLWVGSCLTSFQSVGANCSRFERQMRSQADWPKLGECMSHTGKVLEVSRESGVGQNLECVQRALETLGPTCKYSFYLKDLVWWLNIRSPYELACLGFFYMSSQTNMAGHTQMMSVGCLSEGYIPAYITNSVSYPPAHLKIQIKHPLKRFLSPLSPPPPINPSFWGSIGLSLILQCRGHDIMQLC